MTNEEKRAIYWEILDVVLEDSGHVAPPAGSFTVKDYLQRAKERGVTGLSGNAALTTLKKRMDAGELGGRKMQVGDRQRWVFWPANGQEAPADG